MPAAYLKGPSDVLPSTNIAHWCTGKAKFDSAVIAAEVAARRRDKKRESYFCRTCGSYHVGAQRQPSASKEVAADLIRAS